MTLIGPLVLLGLVSLVEGEVVESFAASCPQFFMNGVPPTELTDQNHPGRYKQICQKYKGKYRFATLYDTRNRIPVYSAYQYRGHDKVDRKNGWMIEPQLDLDPNSGEWRQRAEMTTEGSQTHGRAYGKQALDVHYSTQNENGDTRKYQRGHLYPHCHNCDPAQAESTFTLTNAAPQDEEDNTDWYGQVEKVAANMINNWCQQDTAHVVTGVVPGHQWMEYIRKRPREERGVGPGDTHSTTRVNVPNYFWSAVCCKCRVDNTVYLSEGFLAATKTGIEKINGKHPGQGWKMVANMMPLETLNEKLSELYPNSNFKVFGDMCNQDRFKKKLKESLGVSKKANKAASTSS